MCGRGWLRTAAAALLLSAQSGCPRTAREREGAVADQAGAKGLASTDDTPAFAQARAQLCDELRRRGIRDVRVLGAMGRVLRHALVPEAYRDRAYEDRPLPIGESQTISQPYIVALMTELARVDRGTRVLEIGTGSGYQAAVLAELGAEVYTIEIVDKLAIRARQDLSRLGYGRIHFRVGDGRLGWPEAAPFDVVMATAAPARVPQAFKDQLAPGGRLVIPVGEVDQQLRLITRTGAGFEETAVAPVRFVPMTGRGR